MIDFLFSLPSLAFLAFAGNPCLPISDAHAHAHLLSIDWADLKVETVLGEGASGIISRARWISKNSVVAVKVFKGALTSDGLPSKNAASNQFCAD